MTILAPHLLIRRSVDFHRSHSLFVCAQTTNIMSSTEGTNMRSLWFASDRFISNTLTPKARMNDSLFMCLFFSCRFLRLLRHLNFVDHFVTFAWHTVCAFSLLFLVFKFVNVIYLWWCFRFCSLSPSHSQPHMNGDGDWIVRDFMSLLLLLLCAEQTQIGDVSINDLSVFATIILSACFFLLFFFVFSCGRCCSLYACEWKHT